MNALRFSFKGSIVPKGDISKVSKKLAKEIEAMNTAAAAGYSDPRASINLPLDRKMLEDVMKVVNEKRSFDPEYLVVIGIGGSSLGTIAVQEAVLGRHYNQLNHRPKVLYADTVDPDDIKAIISLIEPALREGRNILVNCISKSGGTTEPAANFEIIVDLLKRYRDDYNRYVVVTTGRGSMFWNLAEKEGFTAIDIPPAVGGRYSVFSNVGLFPLGMLGIDLGKLLAGASSMRNACLSKDVNKNPAAMSALLHFIHWKKKRNIDVMFMFSKDLESVGKWYRQLMGESIGKEFDVRKKKVSAGITPTVAIGSIDLHSMAQLYLGGPQDKFTTFVEVEKANSDVKIPSLKGYENLVENIQGRNLSEVMGAISGGVKAAFMKGKRPFAEAILPDKSEKSIAQFLQFKMMEMMYLGYLMEVNPFDQPNVESYKAETKRILSGR